MKKEKQEYLQHRIKPFVSSDSRVLILGTFPSPKSREIGFYYGHPQNRFWKVLAAILKQKIPMTVDEKKEFLKRNKISLWDVLDSCSITGASDSSIKNPKPNNIAEIIKDTDIKHIFLTGQKAGQLYKKYCQGKVDLNFTILPSTSPANCAMNLETLENKYRIILNYLE